MTIGKMRFLTLFFLIIAPTIIYLASKFMSANESKILYIDMDIDKNLYDDITVNLELLRNSTQYSEYAETKLISIHSQEKYNNLTRKIDLDSSFVYEIFVNYKNEKFFNISKDQIYTHLNTNVKNKFEIKEIDNEIVLLDYGLYKADEKYPDTYDSYSLKYKNISELPNSEKFTQSLNNDRFVVQPLDMDSINYFSKLPKSELEEFKFIPSDQEKIEALSEK